MSPTFFAPNAPSFCYDLLDDINEYGDPEWFYIPGSGQPAAVYDYDWGVYGFSVGVLEDASNSEILGLAIHEMAHQYFGPGSENIATYYQDVCT